MSFHKPRHWLASDGKLLINKSCVIWDIVDCFRKLINWMSENRLIIALLRIYNANWINISAENPFSFNSGHIERQATSLAASKATKFCLFVRKNKTFHRAGKASKWNGVLKLSLLFSSIVYQRLCLQRGNKLVQNWKCGKLWSSFHAPQTEFQLYVTCCRMRTCGSRKNYMIKRFSSCRVASMCGGAVAGSLQQRGVNVSGRGTSRPRCVPDFSQKSR